MSHAINRVVLRSDDHFGRNAPPAALGEILRLLPGAVRLSIRMAFEGRSTARGQRPHWLSAMSDIRLVDYSGQDETVLHFACPVLADAAPELYQQQEFAWSNRPAPTDTGFDLLGDVLSDIAAENSDSERYDPGLLRHLRKFGHGLNGTFQEIDFSSRRYTEASPAVVNCRTIETARQLTSETPRPLRTRIVGVLDMLRASTQAFALKLDDGHEVRGVLTSGEVTDYTHLLEKRVAILGKSVFRPSGRVLRIDADEIHMASADDTFFSQMPRPIGRRLDVRQIVREQSHKRGVAAIIGKWPGDETDEQIAAALRELDQ